MTPEQWTRAKELFQEAVDRPPGERETFLRAACPEDPALVAEVLALLRAHAAAGPFLDVPAAVGAEPSAVAELAGRSLGPYRLLRLLGRGGMGEVYLADDTRLKRPVALKVLPSGPSADSLASRFAREARAASSLTHPNVAHIYDVGEDGGVRYIAMEYVQGRQLADLVEAGPLDTV